MKTMNGRQKRVIAAWLIPLGMLAFVCFAMRPGDPDLVFVCRLRNFLRASVGVVSYAGFRAGLTDPNGLFTHLAMALLFWPILLSAACLTRANRIPLGVHFGASLLWCVSGLLIGASAL